MPLLGVVRQTAAVVTPEFVEGELEFREAGVGESEPGQEAVQELGREEEGQAAAQEQKPWEPDLAGAGISGQRPLPAGGARGPAVGHGASESASLPGPAPTEAQVQ